MQIESIDRDEALRIQRESRQNAKDDVDVAELKSRLASNRSKIKELTEEQCQQQNEG